MNNITSINPEALGWLMSPKNVTKYFQQMNVVKQRLAAKGIGPDTPVYIAALDPEADDFDPDAPKTTKPACISEVFGWVAVRCFHPAAQTHRLATQEEIDRFHKEQKEREQQMAAVTALSQGQGTLRSTAAFAEAAARVGPQKGKAS